MKRPGLEMEDVKIMGRRSKASARFSGSDPMRGEASRHVENLDTGGVGDEVQIQSDAGRDADHQVFGYLSNSRTSVHIPESGMIPQLRFNPGKTMIIMSRTHLVNNAIGASTVLNNHI